MSKKIKYTNGFVGVANDTVAAILEKKCAAKILGDSAPKGDDKKSDDKKGDK